MTTLDQEQLYMGRCLAVKLRKEEKLSYAKIAARLGHCRQWVSRWCNREDLRNRSTRPHHSPRKTHAKMESRIVELGLRTGWGRHRIHRQLSWELRDNPQELKRLPSPSGIERIRQRNRLVTNKPKRPSRPPPRDYGEPNDLWEGDIMVDTLADNTRVETYKLVDCASRMELMSYSAPSLDTHQVIGCVLEAFKAFGLPKAVQHDNGTQFCDTQHREMPGKLDLVMHHLGVHSRHIPPAHAQENGIVERLVRTTREERVCQVDGETLATLRDSNARFQSLYNQQRCHTASGKPPVYSYRPCPRPFSHSFDLSQVKEGGPGALTTRKVIANGSIKIRKHQYFVGRAYAHRTATIQLKDGQATVTINNQIVKVLTLKPLELKCHIGPCTIGRYRGN